MNKPETQPVALTAAEDTRRLHAARRVLCDIDGCLISGTRVLPGALEFTRLFADRLMLVSNNSTDTRHSLQERLQALGFTLSLDQLTLAGEEALNWTASQFGPGPVFLLANARMRAAAAERGLMHSDYSPRSIIICRDTDLTLDRLERALHHIANGLPVVLANDDITHPGEHGPAIESGALLRLLEECHPPAQVIRIGKPQPGLLNGALGHVAPGDAVMIGDNQLTDIAAARTAGIHPILIGAASDRWLNSLI